MTAISSNAFSVDQQLDDDSDADETDEKGGLTVRYTLTAPLRITPRLMPGMRIGDATLSVEIIGHDGGRNIIGYALDYPGGAYEAQDVTIPPRRDDSPESIIREALRTILVFLDAAAEQYAGSGRMGTTEPADGWIFPVTVAEWSYINSDEIAMAIIDLEESA